MCFPRDAMPTSSKAREQRQLCGATPGIASALNLLAKGLVAGQRCIDGRLRALPVDGRPALPVRLLPG